MINSKNIHTSNTIQTEQGTCVFQKIHVYSHTNMHVTMWKRDSQFEREQQEVCENFG